MKDLQVQLIGPPVAIRHVPRRRMPAGWVGDSTHHRALISGHSVLRSIGLSTGIYWLGVRLTERGRRGAKHHQAR